MKFVVLFARLLKCNVYSRRHNVYSPRHFRSSYKVDFGHLYSVILTILQPSSNSHHFSSLVSWTFLGAVVNYSFWHSGFGARDQLEKIGVRETELNWLTESGGPNKLKTEGPKNKLVYFIPI